MGKHVRKQKFQQQARNKRKNIFMEFLDFLIHNKKWWLLPIIVILLLMGFFIVLSGTAIAPFIYPFF